jgi:hypothetical protein
MGKNPLKDPVEFLKQKITAHGTSGVDGTFLTGVSVVVDPVSHAHSDTVDDAKDYFNQLLETDDQFVKLIAHFATQEVISAWYHPIDYFGTKGASFLFEREDDLLSMFAILPSVSAETFDEDVEILSHLAFRFADIARLEPGIMRIIIARAELSWSAMETENLLFTLDQESN